jgi:hypothetical protein
MDVSNVSCKQLADLSPWHGPDREPGMFLKGASMKAWALGVYNAHGIHS